MKQKAIFAHQINVVDMHRITTIPKLIIIGICLLAGLLPFRAGAQPRATSQATYKTTSHDFGKIQEADGPVSHTFEFTNTSNSPFLIEFISVSCGCTTPEYSKEPVLPGRTGRIKVTYDPAGRPGVFNTPVIVTSNNRQDQVRLTLQGEVVPRPKTVEDLFPLALSDNGLRATSNSLIFGYMGHGTRKSQSLDIINNGTTPMRLGYQYTAETQTPRSICRVEISPALLQPGQRGQVTFTYDLSGTEIYGLQATAFTLTVNGRATAKPISAYATATDDFSRMTEVQKASAPKGVFSSQFYHFGTVQRNKTLTREFQITNDGGSPLIVRKATANSANVSFSLPKTTIAPGETITLKVTLKTPNRAERMSESISVVVNDPARPMREVRLGANVE